MSPSETLSAGGHVAVGAESAQKKRSLVALGTLGRLCGAIIMSQPLSVRYQLCPSSVLSDL